MAVIVSAMAVMFVLHMETDDSSAEVTESGWCGEYVYYKIFADGTLEICGSGAMYDYGGFTCPPWYDHRDDITRIAIGDNITQLGASAFIGLKHVTELTIPISLNSVTSDMTPAFAGCINIEKVIFTLGKDGCGYNYAVSEGHDCLYYNTPWYLSRDVLKEIVFTDGTEYIGSDSFRELNITSIVLPDTVCSLGCHCFFKCEKLTDITMPVSLNSYGNTDYPAFDGCMAVEKVSFTRGNGVPFDYTDWKRSELNLELTPWNMNPAVAKTIVVSDDVAKLGMKMFIGCNIKELTMPVNGARTFSDYAFYKTYSSLEKVTLTKGTTGAGIDYSWESEIYCPWNDAPNLKTIIVGEGVTHLGSHMFYFSKADTVVIPSSLESFGNATFYTCTIKDLTLPISLNSVWFDDHAAFACVKGLEKVTFTPGSGYGFNYADSEGSNCFYHYLPWYQCRSTLKEIVFEDGIKTIGNNAFRGLNITSLVITDSVESLGAHTFYQCCKLTDLTIPITLDCVGSEKYSAFDECNAVTSLRFTAGTNGVGVDYTDCAPFWCNPFHKPECITLDSGITYIGTQTFAGYTFIGSDGKTLQPTAECLSGHVFEKKGGVMYQSDDLQGISAGLDNVSFDLNSVLKHQINMMIKCTE